MGKIVHKIARKHKGTVKWLGKKLSRATNNRKYKYKLKHEEKNGKSPTYF